ncbi:MAG: FAD-dependent oxidoreductase, partial [Bacteroidaceae bacterium]|nr:FAD-dependent oxidoreductase [Bacteroidaceae bacterium]
MSFNVPQTEKKRVVIVGGGFGGLKLANKLRKSNFQVVLIDRNNYHQFPPLIYQIASSGIEPSSISFPFRKIFQSRKDFYFRMAKVRSIFPEHKIIQTSIGKVKYDYLVLAAGTTTNFFGNKHVEDVAIPMKNVSEAMGLQNALLENLERALTCASERERMELLNVVIVGGGATGVEVAGALSEMKKYIIPKDYPDLPSSLINVYLVEA